MLVKIRVIVLPPHTSEMKNQKQDFQQDIEKISLKYQDSQLNPEEVDQVLKQLRANLLHQPSQESIQVVYDPCTDNFIQRASQVFQKGFEIQVFSDNKQYNVVAKEGKITVSEPDIPVKIPKEEGVRVEIKDAKTLLEIQKHKHPSKIVDLLIDFTKLGAGDIEELGLPQMVSLCKLELKQQIERTETTFTSWKPQEMQKLFTLKGMQNYKDIEELVIFRTSELNCEILSQLQQLKTLKISNCDKFQSVQEVFNIGLKRLEIVECSKINSIVFDKDQLITQSLQELILTKLNIQIIQGLQFLNIKLFQLMNCSSIDVLDFGIEDSCISKTLEAIEIKTTEFGGGGFAFANQFNPVQAKGLKQILGLKNLSLKKLTLQAQTMLQSIDFGSDEEPSTLQKSLVELNMPSCGFETLKGLHHLSLEKIKLIEIRQLKELDFGPENSILSQKLKELDLQGCDIEGIKNIYNLQIEKLTLNSLTKLVIVDFGEEGKPIQQTLKNITVQSCLQLNSMKSFEFLHINEILIRFCAQIKSLCFQNINIQESLKQIKLEGVGIININGIEEVKLEKLFLTGNLYLEEIDFPLDCKIKESLKEFYLSCSNSYIGQQNTVSRLKSLKGIKNILLKTLAIADCQTIDTLELGGVTENDLSPLQKSIEKLQIANSSFSEIIGLELMCPIETKLINLPNLKIINTASQNNGHCALLQIQSCGVDKISGFTCDNIGQLIVSNCDKLETLFSEQNKQLHIQWLNIQSYKIKSCDFLNYCITLQKLELDGIKILTLESLPAIPTLKELSLKNSDVKNLVGSEKQPNLITIYISVAEPQQNQPFGGFAAWNQPPNPQPGFGFQGFGANPFNPAQLAQPIPVVQQPAPFAINQQHLGFGANLAQAGPVQAAQLNQPFNFNQVPNQPNQPVPVQPANQLNVAAQQVVQFAPPLQFESMYGMTQTILNITLKCTVEVAKM